jgi:transcriptional regulator with XRE-family HTH domain
MQQKTLPNKNHKKLDELGSYLFEIRFSYGLTLHDVAMATKLHQNSISRIEHGFNMTLNSLVKLADYYQISISELFND